MEKELTNKRVSLSTKVYERLEEASSLLSQDSDFKFKTILFGKETEPGLISFEVPSEYNTAIHKNHIIKEVIRELLDTRYDSFAFIKVSNSNEDNDDSKELIRGIYSSILIKEKNFLTGVVKVDANNELSIDDINLELYDNNNDRFVSIDKDDISLEKSNAKQMIRINDKKTN